MQFPMSFNALRTWTADTAAYEFVSNAILMHQFNACDSATKDDYDKRKY
jgi:hypothetical protein